MLVELAVAVRVVLVEDLAQRVRAPAARRVALVERLPPHAGARSIYARATFVLATTHGAQGLLDMKKSSGWFYAC